jgi:ABC-2 type transport system permease protein
MWVIANREYKLYFNTPLAYAIALIVLAPVGIIFALNLLVGVSNPYGVVQAPDIGIIVGPMAFLLLLATPALTMRLIADEVRMGTMELLLTAPVRDWELVVGKWLGSFLFVLTIIAISLIFPIILNGLVKPGIDQIKMMAGYLGVILLAATFLGIGVGISSMFSNQFAAFFITLVILVILWWLIGAPANILPTSGEIFSYLDLSGHFYDSFAQGAANLSDIVYCLSLTALGLFLGTLSVEFRRWR